jgi:hypothetical protein
VTAANACVHGQHLSSGESVASGSTHHKLRALRPEPLRSRGTWLQDRTSGCGGQPRDLPGAIGMGLTSAAGWELAGEFSRAPRMAMNSVIPQVFAFLEGFDLPELLSATA